MKMKCPAGAHLLHSLGRLGIRMISQNNLETVPLWQRVQGRRNIGGSLNLDGRFLITTFEEAS